MSNALCIGDNCIDYYLPPINQKFIGGNALNTAVHMKLAGCSVSYMGAVGTDAEGEKMLETLSRRGIDVSHCQIFPTHTALTTVQIDPDGDRHFLHEDRGPATCLHIDEAALNYIHQHKLVHNTWMGGTEDHLQHFHNNAGNQVSMDYGERYEPEFLDKTIQFIDVAFFSMSPEHCAEAEEFARQIVKRGPRMAVVTLGIEGALVFDGQVHFQEAIKAEVVDTLGAGDTFIATFLAHWISERSIAESLELAAKAAAHTCTFFGAWEGSQLPV